MKGESALVGKIARCMLRSTWIEGGFFSREAFADVSVSGRPVWHDPSRRVFLVSQPTIGLHGSLPGMQPVAARHSSEIQESRDRDEFGKRGRSIPSHSRGEKLLRIRRRMAPKTRARRSMSGPSFVAPAHAFQGCGFASSRGPLPLIKASGSDDGPVYKTVFSVSGLPGNAGRAGVPAIVFADQPRTRFRLTTA
jgi:hypothetical protein